MNEVELRHELDEQFHLRYPDSIWTELGEEGVVSCALAKISKGMKKEAVAYVIQQANDKMYWAHHVHPGRKPDSSTIDEQAQYDDTDLLRINVLSEYFAKHAAELPQVRSFREEVLGGSVTTSAKIGTAVRLGYDPCKLWSLVVEKTLTDEEAFAFLKSPATRVMSVDQFREWGIPVVEHEVVDVTCAFQPQGLGNHSGSIVALKFQPSGDTYVVRAANSTVAIDGYRVISGEDAPQFPADRWRYENDKDADLASIIISDDRAPGFLEAALKKRGEVDNPETLARVEYIKEKRKQNDAVRPTQRKASLPFTKTLVYSHFHKGAKNGEWTQAKVEGVWPDSVLDELRAISERLAQDYHWDPAAATWFVLTGRMPWVRALDARTTTIGGEFTDAFVSIKVLPWVSRKTVQQFYRRIQLNLECGGKNAGDTRAMEVFRFVTREAGVRVAQTGKITKWTIRPKTGELPEQPQKQDLWKSLLEKWLKEHPGEKTLRRPSRLRQYYNRGRQTLLEHDYTECMRRASIRASLTPAQRALWPEAAALQDKALNGTATPEEYKQLRRILAEAAVETQPKTGKEEGRKAAFVHK